MSKLKLFFLTFIGTFIPQVLMAHPHIWVYTSVVPVVESGLIQSLKIQWNFDEVYSATFIQEADTNLDGKIEKSEVQHTIKSVFEDDPQSLYPFMYMHLNGQPQKFSLFNPKIWLSDDETLNYSFEIQFKESVPVVGKHEFGFFDPEFYVSFEQSYEMKLPKGVNCNYELKENLNISIYDGLVNPETYKMNCEG